MIRDVVRSTSEQTSVREGQMDCMSCETWAIVGSRAALDSVFTAICCAERDPLVADMVLQLRIKRNKFLGIDRCR